VVALLDSAVVAAFLDRSDAFHAVADARMRQLAGRATLNVSVITYAELLTGAGLGHHARDAVQGFFTDLVDGVHAVDKEVAERAADLRTKQRALRMPDALILATADVRGADVVVTGDKRWRRAGVKPAIEVLEASA
jgi:predicted nucleic acid-binding protein